MRRHYKILYCINAITAGGAERQLSYLAPELARKGNEVHLAYLKEGGSNLERLQNSPVHLHKLKAASNYDPKIFCDLLRLVWNIRPDLIQTWINQMDILGGLVALIKGIPWVLRESNSLKAWPPNLKTIIRKWEGCAATAIVANSQGGAECWQLWGFSGPMFVIGNALPVEEIDIAAPTGLFKSSNGQQDKLILYVGRMEDRQKNIYNLIQALLRIVTGGNVKALVCGDGPDLVRIKAYVRDFGGEDKILLPGVVKNVWGLMKECDVFISVSHYEGLPNSVLEAMACGCPLVVSDIPAHREFLNEQSAVLVNHLDPTAIAEGLRDVLENPQTARTRAKIAQEKVSGRTISAVANQYEEVYHKILAR